MPEELLQRVDSFADEHGYTGRSEVIREAARNLLGEFEDVRLEDRELMAVVTVIFDYETTSVEERMMHLRHEHEHIVASNFHSHVGNHYCMELFVLEGELEAISNFVGQIRATKDTLSVDYSVMPVDDFGRFASPE
jgi:CopG family nickel-responsive transcriptional regulator